MNFSFCAVYFNLHHLNSSQPYGFLDTPATFGNGDPFAPDTNQIVSWPKLSPLARLKCSPELLTFVPSLDGAFGPAAEVVGAGGGFAGPPDPSAD